ncbi:MAG: hypothetical protein ACRD15_05650 [Vicinamibacterales bacterium]
MTEMETLAATIQRRSPAKLLLIASALCEQGKPELAVILAETAVTKLQLTQGQGACRPPR